MRHEESDVGIEVYLFVQNVNEREALLLGPRSDFGNQHRGEGAVLVTHVPAFAERSTVRRRSAEDGYSVALLQGGHVDGAPAVVHSLAVADERVAEPAGIVGRAALDQRKHCVGLAKPDVAGRRGQGGESNPCLYHAQPVLAGNANDRVRRRVGKDHELFVGVSDLAVFFDFAMESIPE